VDFNITQIFDSGASLQSKTMSIDTPCLSCKF